MELRSLVFAVAISILALKIGVMDWRSNGVLERLKNKLTLLDMVYATCVGMTVVFLFLKSAETRAFHFAFVSAGMFLVYIFIRAKAQRREEKSQRSEGLKVERSFQWFQKIKSPLPPLQKGEWLIFLIVVVGFVNALIGLVQFFCGYEVVGTFGAESFFGCFLAVNVPIAFGLGLMFWSKKSSRYRLSVIGNRYFSCVLCVSWLAVLVMIFVVILTKSRTAMIGLGVVLPTMFFATKTQRLKETRNKKKRKSNFALCLRALVAVLFLVIFALFCGKILYKLKPTSAIGRTLIWRVSADMFLKNPVSGVGYGNFANVYNLYQADFFAKGGGTEAQKMAASTIRHAYNWYLETAAEFGFFGLVVFGIFWWLVLMEVYNIFKPHKEHKDTENTKLNIQYSTRNVQYSSEEIKTDYVNLGMAGSVLCFMIMCLFHFPYKIIPTYLIFNIALAWIVTTNENLATDETQMKHG